MEAQALKQQHMEHFQLVSTLESAIKEWKSEHGFGDTTILPPKAFGESSRENVLAAAKSLVLALQGPRNIVVGLSKSVTTFLAHPISHCKELGLLCL